MSAGRPSSGATVGPVLQIGLHHSPTARTLYEGLITSDFSVVSFGREIDW